MSFETHPPIGAVELPPKNYGEDLPTLPVPDAPVLVAASLTLPYNPTDPASAKRHAAKIAAEQIALWESLAKAGNIEASKEARQWADRQARLLGLDATTKTEVIINNRDIRTLPTAELERMLIEGTYVREPSGEDDVSHTD